MQEEDIQEPHLCILGSFPQQNAQMNQIVIDKMVFIKDNERLNYWLKIIISNIYSSFKK